MSDYPYPGLRPFQRDETDIFFGREEHTDHLLDHLRHHHFLAVLGPSGCGKSSLVRTGLLAGLAAGFLKGADWRIAELRPGHRPFARLTGSLLHEEVIGREYRQFLTAAQANPGADTLTRQVLEKHLRHHSYSLHEIIRDLHTPFRLLILVDQFEEIFRYYQHESADEAAAFIALLLAAAQHPDIYVVITMRADFIGDCALFHGLPEAINQGLYLTPRLNRDQLQAAISEPARVFGGEIEAALVSRLLNDAGNDPDQLPLLQHVLMRMWELAGGEGTVSLAHYQQIGSLKNALSNHADSVFNNDLDAEQRRIAEILFRALTELGPDNRAVRRPAKLGEVAALAETDWQAVAQVVEVFRRAGRTFLTPPVSGNREKATSTLQNDLTPDTVLDINHESLIRQWRRLQVWVEQETQSAELYRRLEDSAVRWKKREAAFLQPPELDIALGWLKREQPTSVWARRYAQGDNSYELAQQYLEKSYENQKYLIEQQKLRQLEKNRQKFYSRVMISSSIGIIISIFIIIFVTQWAFSEQNKSAAATEMLQTVSTSCTTTVISEQKALKSILDKYHKKTEESAINIAYRLATQNKSDIKSQLHALTLENNVYDAAIFTRKGSVYYLQNKDIFINQKIELYSVLCDNTYYSKYFIEYIAHKDLKFMLISMLNPISYKNVIHGCIVARYTVFEKNEIDMLKILNRIYEPYSVKYSKSDFVISESQQNPVYIGEILWESKQKTDARRIFNWIFKKNPHDLILWETIVRLEGLSSQPKHWQYLGTARAIQGKITEAKKAFQTAATGYAEILAKNPQDLETLNRDARLAILQKDKQRLQRRLNQAKSMLTPKERETALLPFYAWLLDINPDPQTVLTAIDSLDSNIHWNLKLPDLVPALQELTAEKRSMAEQFMAFFAGEISRDTLGEDLGVP